MPYRFGLPFQSGSNLYFYQATGGTPKTPAPPSSNDAMPTETPTKPAHPGSPAPAPKAGCSVPVRIATTLPLLPPMSKAQAPDSANAAPRRAPPPASPSATACQKNSATGSSDKNSAPPVATRRKPDNQKTFS